MMQIRVHSQNLRGSWTSSSTWIESTIEDSNCECTAILLQDIGPTDLDGPPILRNALKGHKIIANFSTTNKARTVAIIIHKSWETKSILRDDSGSLIGAIVSKGNLSLLLISAYLPAMLNQFGFPKKWDFEDQRVAALVQGEAHAIYSSMLQWTNSSPILASWGRSQ